MQGKRELSTNLWKATGRCLREVCLEVIYTYQENICLYLGEFDFRHNTSQDSSSDVSSASSDFCGRNHYNIAKYVFVSC